MKEPLRMGEGDQLPTALRDAFKTLGSEAPNAETVLRVQRALSALPAAAPGAAAVGGFGAGKLLVIATLIAGGITSALVLNQRAEAPRSERARPAEVEPVAEPAVSEERLGTNAPEVAPVPALEPSAATTRREQPKAGTLQTASEVKAARLESPRAARGASPTAKPAPRASSLIAPHVTRAAEEAPARAEEREPEAAAPSPAAENPPVNEAALLAECKRLAQNQPEQALEKLALLARKVPYGVFVPERELLAIRLHERLGHSAEARELARRFRERYPNSVYLRTLPP